MVVIKVAIFYGNCRFLHIITNLVAINHKLIIAASFVLPEELAAAIEIFGNSGLDALVYLAWANCIEVFAVVGEEPGNNKGEHEEKTTNYLEDGISPTLAK